jgi:hypothetical protein
VAKRSAAIFHSRAFPGTELSCAQRFEPAAGLLCGQRWFMLKLVGESAADSDCEPLHLERKKSFKSPAINKTPPNFRSNWSGGC